ncbi:hypothetical protein FF1_002352 [Malus domestica]
MAAKLGSFKYNFQEKRGCLLSVQKGYSKLGFVHIEEQEPSGSPRCCTFRSVSNRIVCWCRTVQHVSSRAIQMGQSDPRKIIFVGKMDGSSGAGDVLLHDVQGKHSGPVPQMPYLEQDLRHHQGKEQRGGCARDMRVTNEEAANAVAKRQGVDTIVLERREGEKVREIDSDPRPSVLGRSVVDDHGRSGFLV